MTIGTGLKDDRSQKPKSDKSWSN